jgi:prepilin-type N-terminal cleavage/methylation domain-containing protein
MVFRNTSTEAGRRGVTLIELMVSVAIGAIIISAVAYLSFYNARSMAALSNYVDLDQDSRQALDLMTREIRQADLLRSYSTNDITLDTDGSTNNLRFYHDADSRETRIQKNGVTVTLLTECDEFRVSIFGRNNVGSTFSQFPATNATSAKMVRFNWTCSRTILGASVNTESIQSAKIVIRKQNN